LAVPQREPLSAPLLGSLFAVAGLAAGWLVLALETLAQGGAGALVGFGPPKFLFEPPFGLPSLDLGHGAAAHGPWPWAIVLLAGPAAALIAGTVAHLLTEALQAPPWLRTLGFEVFAFAWLRLPLLTLSAGIPGGRGSFARLYDRLGEPESGRWAAIALGLVILWGVTALVAWRAVALGREWLRSDGRVFRRRAVRLVAAYPFMFAAAAYSFERPTAPLGWLAILLGLVLGCLSLRTT
jgi:ribose/xylose/arabinose/galactoside ABC-type transport system permease subunit